MNSDYKNKILSNSGTLPKVFEYIKRLPLNALDLLVSFDPDDLQELNKRIKTLRIHEKERNYVMEIQREYKLPLRPNETLKDTMIRVRLNFLKQKNKQNKANSANNPGSLPIDPLE